MHFNASRHLLNRSNGLFLRSTEKELTRSTILNWIYEKSWVKTKQKNYKTK